jgi:hypothetical protein
MLNIDAFQDLCRKAAFEKDPVKLEDLLPTSAFRGQFPTTGVSARGAGSPASASRHERILPPYENEGS